MEARPDPRTSTVFTVVIDGVPLLRPTLLPTIGAVVYTVFTAVRIIPQTGRTVDVWLDALDWIAVIILMLPMPLNVWTMARRVGQPVSTFAAPLNQEQVLQKLPHIYKKTQLVSRRLRNQLIVVLGIGVSAIAAASIIGGVAGSSFLYSELMSALMVATFVAFSYIASSGTAASLVASADAWPIFYKRCPGCGYDLSTLDEIGICPECGRRYDRRDADVVNAEHTQTAG